MRIGLSVEALSPSLTGIGRYTWELLKGLERNRDDVRYYYAGHWLDDASPLLRGKWQPRNRKNFLIRKFERYRTRRENAGRLFHGPNYFIPQDIEGGIITVHDLSVILFPETHPINRVHYFERHFESSLRRARHIITDSNTIKNEMISTFNLKSDFVTSVNLGVSPEFRPAEQWETAPALNKLDLSHGSYALCVATLEPRKGIDKLLETWNNLPPAISTKMPLVIVGGKGWLSESIVEALDRGIARGWARHPGYVAESELPLLYAGARIFVYPSRYEGFGLPPLEAMACGIPVVVSNAETLVEITKGVAMCADPEDASAFSAAVQRALYDEEWRSDAIKAGLRLAASYQWARCVDETRQLYSEIMDS